MLEIVVPGGMTLRIKHLILDYNGTLAKDGELLPGVEDRLQELGRHLKVHVITADTHGSVSAQLHHLSCDIKIIGAENQDLLKQEYLQNVGSENAVAVGNGRNDVLMLQDALLGICLVQAEGASGAAIRVADIICTDILDVLDLFLKPSRLQATLRN